MEAMEIDPGWAWDDKLAMAQGVQIGNFLYVSGQIALDPAGNLVGQGDMSAQARRVYENIESILQRAGGTLENVVKITAYLTDMSRYSEYSAVRSEFLKRRHPASTTVAVSALAFEGLLVEVEAVAYLP